jgi:hyperosmotically inducible periplasmic protein
MRSNPPELDPRDPRDPVDPRDPLYGSRFVLPRRRWPGLLAAGIIGIGIGAVVLTSFHSPQPAGAPPAPAVATAPTTPPADGSASATADGQNAPTADVTAAVKAALATDPALATAKVDVTADAGVVTLVGSAPDSDARTRAELLASAAPGVSRVDNQLTVGGTTTQ